MWQFQLLLGTTQCKRGVAACAIEAHACVNSVPFIPRWVIVVSVSSRSFECNCSYACNIIVTSSPLCDDPLHLTLSLYISFFSYREAFSRPKTGKFKKNVMLDRVRKHSFCFILVQSNPLIVLLSYNADFSVCLLYMQILPLRGNGNKEHRTSSEYRRNASSNNNTRP